MKKIIDQLISKHGFEVLAEICGVTRPAIHKWKKKGRFPRTEWTGETNYAQRIAEFDPEFTKSELLELPSTDGKESAEAG